MKVSTTLLFLHTFAKIRDNFPVRAKVCGRSVESGNLSNGPSAGSPKRNKEKNDPADDKTIGWFLSPDEFTVEKRRLVWKEPIFLRDPVDGQAFFFTVGPSTSP